MLVYKTRDYCVFGLSPLYGIPEDTKEHDVSEAGSVSVLILGLGDTYRPNKVCVFCPSLKDGNIVFFCVLEYQMMDKVQKPSNPENDFGEGTKVRDVRSPHLSF
jgi:hypothetical protein